MQVPKPKDAGEKLTNYLKNIKLTGAQITKLEAKNEGVELEVRRRLERILQNRPISYDNDKLMNLIHQLSDDESDVRAQAQKELSGYLDRYELTLKQIEIIRKEADRPVILGSIAGARRYFENLTSALLDSVKISTFGAGNERKFNLGGVVEGNAQVPAFDKLNGKYKNVERIFAGEDLKKFVPALIEFKKAVNDLTDEEFKSLSLHNIKKELETKMNVDATKKDIVDEIDKVISKVSRFPADIPK